MTTKGCWFFSGGGGESPRPSHVLPRWVGAQLDGWTRRRRDRGRPSPRASAAAQRPSNRRDALPVLGFSLPFSFPPVLPLFLSQYRVVFLASNSWWREKNSSELTSPSHKYACAFPESFSAPFSPSTGRVCNAKDSPFIQRTMSALQFDNFIRLARTYRSLLPTSSVFSQLTLFHTIAEHILHLFRVLPLPTFGGGGRQRARQSEFQEESVLV